MTKKKKSHFSATGLSMEKKGPVMQVATPTNAKFAEVKGKEGSKTLPTSAKE